MASSKEYLDFVLEQLSGLDGISYRPMMGEYILYCQGRVIGGIYDDRFLVKPVKAAVERMPDALRELPYEGAKEMLLVDRIEDPDFLRELIGAMLRADRGHAPGASRAETEGVEESLKKRRRTLERSRAALRNNKDKERLP